MPDLTGAIVLILGSAPSALESRNWDRRLFSDIVAINNAWRVRPDWTHLIHPEDFPADRMPPKISAGQRIVTAADYVPLQNGLGGFVYAGGTMAFTAAYWALAALRPAVLAFCGCDMVYPRSGPTHFYGTGASDPLRADVTLRSLEAKSARLALIAARLGCACVNLSSLSSRLVFPRATTESLQDWTIRASRPGNGAVERAEDEERRLGYFVASGRYWEVEDRFDPARIDALDALWLSAYAETGAEPEPLTAAL